LWGGQGDLEDFVCLLNTHRVGSKFKIGVDRDLVITTVERPVDFLGCTVLKADDREDFFIV